MDLDRPPYAVHLKPNPTQAEVKAAIRATTAAENFMDTGTLSGQQQAALVIDQVVLGHTRSAALAEMPSLASLEASVDRGTKRPRTS